MAPQNYEDTLAEQAAGIERFASDAKLREEGRVRDNVSRQGVGFFGKAVQLLKSRFVLPAAGALSGAVVGGVALGAVGSVIPVFGTAVGAIAGMALGGWFGAKAGIKARNAIRRDPDAGQRPLVVGPEAGAMVGRGLDEQAQQKTMTASRPLEPKPKEEMSLGVEQPQAVMLGRPVVGFREVARMRLETGYRVYEIRKSPSGSSGYQALNGSKRRRHR